MVHSKNRSAVLRENWFYRTGFCNPTNSSKLGLVQQVPDKSPISRSSIKKNHPIRHLFYSWAIINKRDHRKIEPGWLQCETCCIHNWVAMVSTSLLLAEAAGNVSDFLDCGMHAKRSFALRLGRRSGARAASQWRRWNLVRESWPDCEYCTGAQFNAD